jgi:hypothetical protein
MPQEAVVVCWIKKTNSARLLRQERNMALSLSNDQCGLQQMAQAILTKGMALPIKP